MSIERALGAGWPVGAGLLLVTILAPVVVAETPQAELRDPPPSPPAMSISGVVVSDQSPAAPLAGAELVLTGGSTDAPRTATTNRDGAFSFTGLAAGRYRLTASLAGFVTQAFGATRFDRPGMTIVVTDGQQVSDLTVGLSRVGTISGVVRRPDGTPAYLARVIAVEPTTPGFAAAPQPVTTYQAGASYSTATNAQGEYHLAGLPPRSYLIRAYFPYQDLSVKTKPTRAVFYPDAVDETDATAVALAPGEARDGVNVTLRETTLVEVSGTLLNVPSETRKNTVFEVSGTLPNVPSETRTITFVGSLARPALRLVPEGMGTSTATPDEDGRFTFTGVPPGFYTVEYAPSGLSTPLFTASAFDVADRLGFIKVDAWSAVWARADVRVDGYDISGLAIDLRNTVSVAGRVGNDSVPAQVSGVSVVLSGVLVRSGLGGPSRRVQPAANGLFSIPVVVPGRYRIEVSASAAKGSSPVFLQKVTMGGRDVTDLDVDIPPDQDITDLVVTVTRQTQQVTGTMLDELGGTPLGLNLLAFPVERRLWVPLSRRIRVASRATDGSFEMEDLPAGEYYLVALPGAEPDDLSTASFLEPLVAGAIRFTLAPGEHRVQHLRTPAGQRP